MPDAWIIQESKHKSGAPWCRLVPFNASLFKRRAMSQCIGNVTAFRIAIRTNIVLDDNFDHVRDLIH